MSTQGIRAGKAFVEVFTDSTKLKAGLRSAENQVRDFGNSISGIGRTMMGLSATVIAPVVGAVKAFSSMGDQMGKMSKRTGVSVEALSGLKFAADRSGSSVESLEKGIRRMQATTRDANLGLSTAVDALSDLGLTAGDLDGMLPEQQFKVLADRISQVEDPSQKAAIAMKIFGRAGTELLPMLAGGAQGLDKFINEARDLGLIMKTEDAAAAEALTDAMGDVWAQVKMAAFHIGSALAPVLQELAESFKESAVGIMDWVKENRDLIVSITKVAATAGIAGVALMAMGKTIGGVATTIKAVRVALSLLTAHPLIAIGVAAAGVALALSAAHASQYKLNNEMKESLDIGDRQRSADLQRIDRLQQLAKNSQLNNNQMREANRIIKTLEARYGDLGISVDKTTGKIHGLYTAQSRLNKAMKDAAVRDLQNSLNEINDNIAKMQEEQLWRTGGISWDGIAVPFGEIGNIEKLGKKITDAMDKAQLLRLRIKALQSGDVSEATLAGTEPASASAGSIVAIPDMKQAEKAADLVARWQRRLHQLKLQQITDEEARAKALLYERYNHEYQLARENGEAQKTILAAYRAEYQATTNEFAKQQAEIKKTQQEAIELANKSRGDTIAELELRAKYKGVELEQKLLELREAQAIIAAKEQGENLELVKKEFELRKKMLGQGREAEDVKTLVRGGFRSSRSEFGFDSKGILERIATASERGAKAAETTAENTKENTLMYV